MLKSVSLNEFRPELSSHHRASKINSLLVMGKRFDVKSKCIYVCLSLLIVLVLLTTDQPDYDQHSLSYNYDTKVKPKNSQESVLKQLGKSPKSS